MSNITLHLHHVVKVELKEPNTLQGTAGPFRTQRVVFTSLDGSVSEIVAFLEETAE